MSLAEAILIWPDRPALSFLVLFVIAMPFLYVAREPVHALIARLVRVIVNPLRLISRWLSETAIKMRLRNREVLFAQGGREVRLSIEREFERVTTLVQRDLEGYPAMQRKLMDEITRIEEDYKQSGEVPPPPPEWVKAVDGFAKIKNNGDGVVERILADIRDSIDDIYKKILAEYRGAYQERHHILKRSLPFWRSANQTLQQVDRNITGLHDSAAKIDANVIKLQGIFGKSNETENALTSSASTQFFISGLVMLIAFGGAYVNFKLISLPMSAMVGGGDYITANLRAAEVAAMVIILFEALMGLFLMETLRFTNLFPLGNMTEKMRRYLMWASLIILLILAGVEVALAVMRDTIVAADVALKQTLGAGEAGAAVEAGWVTRIPTFGQMILGFTLPFALAFVAIPLEYFIHSGRIVLGAVFVQSLRGGSFVLRLGANLIRETGKLLIAFYDIVIFVPLAIERWVKRGRSEEPKEESTVRPVPSLENQYMGR
ncbi:MAG: hypothetical protein JSU95_12940 [Betaproteobacteria bacterium]|nr:MAG: hypothetical protein JSU95_12940 [Betaproteobacteria bacterium]